MRAEGADLKSKRFYQWPEKAVLRSERSDVMHLRVDLRRGRAGVRTRRAGVRPGSADLRQKRPDLRPDLRLERLDFWPEMPDLKA